MKNISLINKIVLHTAAAAAARLESIEFTFYLIKLKKMKHVKHDLSRENSQHTQFVHATQALGF